MIFITQHNCELKELLPVVFEQGPQLGVGEVSDQLFNVTEVP